MEMTSRMPVHVPRFDDIDYSNPKRYLFLDPSFAGDGAVEHVGAQVRHVSPEASLGAIWRWVRDNLEDDRVQSDYRWRTAAEIIDRKRYFGCAEHALMYGCLARACGIPVVWLKSLDVPWIRRFTATHEFDGGSGHVYLEVFLGGRWRLLDATQDEIFDHYDPTQRLLPARGVVRYGYDKGGDPRQLVLSLDWGPWQVETQTFFRDFDVRLLDGAVMAVSGPARRLAV